MSQFLATLGLAVQTGNSVESSRQSLLRGFELKLESLKNSTVSGRTFLPPLNFIFDPLAGYGCWCY